MAPLKVSLVGSGNWGSAVAKLVGENCAKPGSEFDREVLMWVKEEEVDGQPLTTIINKKHENVKYLKDIKLPENVVASPDLIGTCVNADILIFVVPQQFVEDTCKQLHGKIKSSAIGVTLIKGLAATKQGTVKLVSEQIQEILGLPMSAMMGANLAPEVAREQFCEATIGYRNKEHGALLKRLFQTENFRVTCVEDAHTVELCGALKNIVGVAAGFCDGLEYGDNTKSAVIRLGLTEMRRFVDEYYPKCNPATFFESCGIADLITTCYGGRNRKCAEAFVKTGKTMEELEKEMLGGQHLQGAQTAAQVNLMLKAGKLEDKYPIFTVVHRICTNQVKPDDFVVYLRKYPEQNDRDYE